MCRVRHHDETVLCLIELPFAGSYALNDYYNSSLALTHSHLTLYLRDRHHTLLRVLLYVAVHRHHPFKRRNKAITYDARPYSGIVSRHSPSVASSEATDLSSAITLIT